MRIWHTNHLGTEFKFKSISNGSLRVAYTIVKWNIIAMPWLSGGKLLMVCPKNLWNKHISTLRTSRMNSTIVSASQLNCFMVFSCLCAQHVNGFPTTRHYDHHKRRAEKHLKTSSSAETLQPLTFATFLFAQLSFPRSLSPHVAVFSLIRGPGCVLIYRAKHLGALDWAVTI